MPDPCLAELPSNLWNLLWRLGPLFQQALACFPVPGAGGSSKFFGGLWALHERPCRNREVWLRRWLLMDGPIYIKGSYYAWNHSSIICFREFNQSIFQFFSDSGSDANEGSQGGQCYFPFYLQRICLKSITLIVWKCPPPVPLWGTREALVRLEPLSILHTN